MDRTTVVNCRKEKLDIYIGRPAFGGTLPKPFPSSKSGIHKYHFGNPFISPRDGNRKTVIEKFEKWIRGKEYKILEPKRRKWILKNLYRLRNKRLGCFCSPKPCHGDIYVKLIKELNEKKKNLLSTGE